MQSSGRLGVFDGRLATTDCAPCCGGGVVEPPPPDDLIGCSKVEFFASLENGDNEDGFVDSVVRLVAPACSVRRLRASATVTYSFVEDIFEFTPERPGFPAPTPETTFTLREEQAYTVNYQWRVQAEGLPGGTFSYSDDATTQNNRFITETTNGVITRQVATRDFLPVSFSDAAVVPIGNLGRIGARVGISLRRACDGRRTGRIRATPTIDTETVQSSAAWLAGSMNSVSRYAIQGPLVGGNGAAIPGSFGRHTVDCLASAVFRLDVLLADDTLIGFGRRCNFCDYVIEDQPRPIDLL